MGIEVVRTAVALRSVRAVAALSRRLGLGSGSTVGGRVGLAVDPLLLGRLGAGRPVALVSGTNGKTTTTRLLAEALGGPEHVATSVAGANMPAGLVSAFAASSAGREDPAVLEVDEGYLGTVAAALHPGVVVLLNLSRDQLDRVSEVRMVAKRWRDALDGVATTVVANADDPLVAWAAGTAARTVWVAAGGRWRSDAFHCPVCGEQLGFAGSGDEHGWACRCGFARPAPEAELSGGSLRFADGRAISFDLALPGRFNRANAAMAAVAATQLGVEPELALARMAAVREVSGRFSLVRRGGTDVRLLLAKNPAGWTELLELLHGGDDPVVVGINARDADGHDPSWLWDVPFELLAGRFVIATGERRRDLAVRLRHGLVDHAVADDALGALGTLGTTRADYIGNYTAFQELRRRIARSTRRGGGPTGTPAQGAGAPGAAARGAAERGRSAARSPTTSALRVVVVHPDLLGTYGDGGNGTILANRARWRDIPAELVLATSDRPLPASADLYCLGGGEDGPQTRSASLLADGALARAVEGGAAVLAVCAGYQILGHSFPGGDGSTQPGVGLLDVETHRSDEPRAVGELLIEIDPAGGLGPLASPPDGVAPADLLRLTGFENHAGRTVPGRGVRPLGRVVHGVGNDGRSDGAYCGRVIGTYLHGPVLARNTALADLLLGLATGLELAPLDDEEELILRAERLAAIGRGARGRAAPALRGRR
ncbi:MAG TPA: MurT ligase domain-containing protein [Acidimicrobiales bacterium]|nr:MurT ligase domain-containing protein [Acidimicrobiales bacterium]